MTKWMSAIAPAVTFLFVAAAFGGMTVACGSGDEGPTMKPGENCLSHHSFSAAGTVFGSPTAGAGEGLAGATVTITDTNGKQVSLVTNSAGNFYTDDPLAFPVDIQVASGSLVQTMTGAASGGCNGCHTQPPSDGAPGRVYVN